MIYKSVRLDCAYRLDLAIEDMLLAELKTVERILPVHEAQLLTYLRLSGRATGLILNFHVAVLKGWYQTVGVGPIMSFSASLRLCGSTYFRCHQTDAVE